MCHSSILACNMEGFLKFLIQNSFVFLNIHIAQITLIVPHVCLCSICQKITDLLEKGKSSSRYSIVLLIKKTLYCHHVSCFYDCWYFVCVLCFWWAFQWKRALLFVCFCKGFAQNLWGPRWIFLIFNDFLQNYLFQVWYIFSITCLSLTHSFSWFGHWRYFQRRFNCQFFCGKDHYFCVVNFVVQKNQLEVDFFHFTIVFSINSIIVRKQILVSYYSVWKLGPFPLPSR